eukprot:g12137.t1
MLPQPAALPTLPLFQDKIETNLEPCPCKQIQSNLRSNSIAFLEMGVGVDCEGRLCKLINFGKKAYNIVKEKVKDVVDDVGDAITAQRDGNDEDLKGKQVTGDDFNFNMMSNAFFATFHAYQATNEILTNTDLELLGDITVQYPDDVASVKFIKMIFTEEPHAKVKVYKDSKGICYVAYRGSKLNHDWLVNMKVGGMNVDVALTGALFAAVSPVVAGAYLGTKFDKLVQGGKSDKDQCVHEGFYNHMKLTLTKVVNLLAEQKCKQENTVVTGHSLGGATATLASIAGVGKYLYTIGAPRSLCKSCPAELNDIDSHRFVNAEVVKDINDSRDYTEIYDLVPQVPLVTHEFKHCIKKSYRVLETVTKDDSKETVEFTANEISKNKPKLKAGLLGSGFIRKAFNGFVGIHFVKQYIEALCKVKPVPLMKTKYCDILHMDKTHVPISADEFKEISKAVEETEKGSSSSTSDNNNDDSAVDLEGTINVSTNKKSSRRRRRRRRL